MINFSTSKQIITQMNQSFEDIDRLLLPRRIMAKYGGDIVKKICGAATIMGGCYTPRDVSCAGWIEDQSRQNTPTLARQ